MYLLRRIPSYKYDANGNILELTRNAYGTQGQTQMDDLAYEYNDIDNKLWAVKENLTGSLNGTKNDIDGNILYDYDNIGNLTSLKSSVDGNLDIKWNVFGKIKSIIKTPEIEFIDFIYDAAGNRVRKDVYTNPEDPSSKVSTYYVRDAQGNIMAIYNQNISQNGEVFTADYSIVEQPIYGSNRLGVAKSGDNIGNMTFDMFNPDSRLDRCEEWKNVDYDTEQTNWMVPVKSGVLFKLMKTEIINNNFGIFEPLISGELPDADIIVNLSVAESLQNELKLFSLTILDQSTGKNYCNVYNANADLLGGSDQINSMAEAQSVFMKKPGDDNKYYLITLGSDDIIYYHSINMNLAENIFEITQDPVDPNHVLCDEGGYGYSFATVEKYAYSTNSTSCILYYTQYSTSSFFGSTALFAIELTEGGFQEPVLISSYNSLNKPKAGEIQISPQGDQIAFATVATNTMIHVEDLSSNYLSSVNSTSIDMGSDAGDYMSFDFSAYDEVNNTNYLYISSLANGLEQYNFNTQVLQYKSGDKGSVRRALNGKIHIAPVGQKYLTEVEKNNPFSTSKINIDLTYLSEGLLANQPLKIIETARSRDEILAQRFINRKSYELKDHLGNVNSVVSDLKTSDISPGGLASNFKITLNSLNNYYPGGMLMPGRTSNPSDYRFGFNGQEKDDEIAGTGNSYTAMFWQYDPRIVRRWNRDPIVKTHESPYATFANNPIWLIDPFGADSSLYNSNTGAFIDKGVTPEDDKTALWQVDPSTDGYDPDNPWATATALTYTVGKDSELGYVKGSKLRKNHPLAGKGWNPGDQVYEEDLLTMTSEFNRTVNQWRTHFVLQGNQWDQKAQEMLKCWYCGTDSYTNIILAKKISFIGMVGPNMKFDLKSQSRSNLQQIPSYAAVIIGQYSFYKGRLMNYDDFGNIAFGSWGRSYGYKISTLTQGADIDQLFHTGSSDPGRDQYMIKLGFDLFK